MSDVCAFLKAKTNDPMENIFCKPTTRKEALEVLFNHFCEGIICPSPLHPSQIRTEMVAYILTTYESKKFRSYPWWKRICLRIHSFITNTPLYKYF